MKRKNRPFALLKQEREKWNDAEGDGWRCKSGNSAAQIKEMVTEREDVARKYRVKVVPRIEWQKDRCRCQSKGEKARDAEKASCGRSAESADPRGRYNTNEEMANDDFAWSEIRGAVECFRRRSESAIFRSRCLPRTRARKYIRFACLYHQPR